MRTFVGVPDQFELLAYVYRHKRLLLSRCANVSRWAMSFWHSKNTSDNTEVQVISRSGARVKGTLSTLTHVPVHLLHEVVKPGYQCLEPWYRWPQWLHCAKELLQLTANDRRVRIKKAIQTSWIVFYFFGRYDTVTPVDNACETNAFGRMQFLVPFETVIEEAS